MISAIPFVQIQQHDTPQKQNVQNFIAIFAISSNN
jgi:hypothetical protein